MGVLASSFRDSRRFFPHGPACKVANIRSAKTLTVGPVSLFVGCCGKASPAVPRPVPTIGVFHTVLSALRILLTHTLCPQQELHRDAIGLLRFLGASWDVLPASDRSVQCSLPGCACIEMAHPVDWSAFGHIFSARTKHSDPGLRRPPLASHLVHTIATGHSLIMSQCPQSFTSYLLRISCTICIRQHHCSNSRPDPETDTDAFTPATLSSRRDACICNLTEPVSCSMAAFPFSPRRGASSGCLLATTLPRGD